MKRLIKTIECSECEIYAIINYRRIKIGNAIPKIEIYQQETAVKTLGRTYSTYKRYEFSIIVCPSPEIEQGAADINKITSFEIRAFLERKDGVFVPFEFVGLTDFYIDSGNEWIFNLNSYELTRELISL